MVKPVRQYTICPQVLFYIERCFKMPEYKLRTAEISRYFFAELRPSNPRRIELTGFSISPFILSPPIVSYSA